MVCSEGFFKYVVVGRARYAVLPDVYGRESVEPFRAALLASLPPPSAGATPGGSARELPLEQHPPFLSDPEPFVAALAPRLRQVLRRVLAPPQSPRTPDRRPAVQLFDAPSLFINTVPADATELPPQAWHRDRGGHPAGHGAAYGYPECAHVATYLRDMVSGSGATELIVGSHRDASSTPEESSGRRVAFNLRAQDAAVYDQRCYHRRGRFAPAEQSGDQVRLFLNMAFFQNQCRGSSVAPMPDGLARLWLAATSNGEDELATLLGGRYSAASIWAAMDAARRKDPAIKALLDAAVHKRPSRL